MCRPDLCLLLRGRRSPLLRERSPRGPARLVSFPPPTLSLGRLRRGGAGQIASTEPSSTTPRAMRRDARAGNMSPGGPGAILWDARRSPITFSTRPIPLAGAGSSLIYTFRLVRIAFSSSLLSAGFWKNAVAPAFRARSSKVAGLRELSTMTGTVWR